MRIEDLRRENDDLVWQASALLLAAFAEHYPEAWPALADARAEVEESFAPERISRVALADDGTAIGWIGGISQYNGNVWELHPLAVHPDRQGQGIGRALVRDFEAIVQTQGGLTVVLGTDDENARTSLGGEDLFPDVLAHLAGVRDLRRHPFSFYQKLGYVVVGVVPDANGLGKPDILMAKSVVR